MSFEPCRNRNVVSILRYCAAAIIVATTAMPASAQAQTPTSQTPPAAAAPEPPHKFSGSATVSASVQSGRTDLTGIAVDFRAKRPYSRAGAINVSFDYSYADTNPPGEFHRITVADRLTSTFDVEQNVGRRYVMMLRAQALRDPISKISYRIGQMDGFGVRFENKRVKARVLPGVAFLKDEMHLAEGDGFKVHYGVFGAFTVTLTPAWSFDNSMSFSRSFSNPGDYITAFDASLTGAVTKRLSIQLSYQYNYENILPVGVEPRYQKTGAGLQFNF